MSKTSSYQLPLKEIAPHFGQGFLKDHAGKILTDPQIAIVEIVANCWDAGADLVEISWPNEIGGEIIVKDNGTGMTYEEFVDRWSQLSFNRLDELGIDVIFPTGNQISARKAFGRNGKGRHGMFCFSNSYEVRTCKKGVESSFRVSRSINVLEPFSIEPLTRFETTRNGTVLTTNIDRNFISIKELTDLIGSKFVADPSFKIRINNELVELTDLEHLSETSNLEIDNLGIVKIRHFDTKNTGRTTKQNGVAWWVNKRLVGEPSWRGFDKSIYLDGRKSEAKRHTFVVEADFLQDSVEADWSGFQDTSQFEIVNTAVNEFIMNKLQILFSDINKTRKVEAISVNRKEITELSVGSRKIVGTFIEEIQRISPTITQRDLDATVSVLAKLEKSRTQFTLIEQLSKMNPDDLDGLSELLDKWTVTEANVVLDTLGKRIRLIEALEKLVENPSSDELHDIQPLFEVGLWMFGPEYESVEFVANKTLSKVIRDLLQDNSVSLLTPRRRPDIVTLPDSSISLYSSDAFDERSEVDGYSKVLIIELKRGDFRITINERRQAEDYAKELRRSGKVGKHTTIIGFVLGTKVDEDIQNEITDGKTVIYARTYSIILRQAHARTFNLLKKLQQLRNEKGVLDDEVDIDIETVINQPEQMELLETNS